MIRTEQLEHLRLHDISVLIFINHNVTKTVAILIKNCWEFIKQLDRQLEDIIKINGIAGLEHPLITGIGVRRDQVIIIVWIGLIVFRRDQAVLCLRDQPQHAIRINFCPLDEIPLNQITNKTQLIRG